MSGLLEVRRLGAGYGAIPVVRDVDLAVHAGEIVCLVGRNGAGKTTTLSAIAGLIRPTAGEVHLDGRRVRHRSAARVAEHGLALVAAGHRVFREMTVRENLRLGAFLRRRDARRLGDDVDEVLALFPALTGRDRQPAGELSGGEQQMLAIAQALLAKPRVLLLDEPSFGLAPAVVDAIYAVLQRLAAADLAVLIVEQEVERALRASRRIYVMESGRIAHHAPARDLTTSDLMAIIVTGGAP